MNLGNLGLHIIEYPTKRFGFVGNVPSAFGTVVPATNADVMAGRAFKNPHTGAINTLKFPSFATRAEAVAFADSHGYTVK